MFAISPSNWLLGIYPKEMKIYVHMKASIWMFIEAFQNSPKLETTQMSFNWWGVRQTMVHPYQGILLSNEEEQTTDRLNNLDDFNRIMLSEKKPIPRHYTLYNYMTKSLK